MDAQMAGFVVRPWVKVILSNRINYRDSLFRQSCFEINRGSGIGQVSDDEIGLLNLSDDPVIDIIVVFESPHEDRHNSSFPESGRNYAIIQFVYVTTPDRHRHKAA
jgi:hypothetical protein